MQVNTINSAYAYSNYNRKNVSRPNFRGALSNEKYYQALNKLKKVNKVTTENFSMSKLKEIIERLGDKYRDLGIHSIGIQIISNKDLPMFLGESASKYDLRGKLGLCVAVGDRNAPIEEMNCIYEAETILAKESDLKNKIC